MSEKTYAFILLYQLDILFNPEVEWCEEYQNLAYDIVKIFSEFKKPESAVEPILFCIERQYTWNSDWFSEFREFLEKLDVEILKYEYISSYKRRPTPACRELLKRILVSEEEIADLENEYGEVLKQIKK